jgi:hypothetical protein
MLIFASRLEGTKLRIDVSQTLLHLLTTKAANF